MWISANFVTILDINSVRACITSMLLNSCNVPQLHIYDKHLPDQASLQLWTLFASKIMGLNTIFPKLRTDLLPTNVNEQTQWRFSSTAVIFFTLNACVSKVSNAICNEFSESSSLNKLLGFAAVVLVMPMNWTHLQRLPYIQLVFLFFILTHT